MDMWKELSLDDFRGTGERNQDGYDLDTFIEKYNPGDYDNPSVTTDALIFAYNGRYEGINNLKLLMIRRKDHPCIGYWALPGGFVNYTEDMDLAVARELEEETGVTGVPLCQLHTWGDADRDPRTRIITTTYLAVIDQASVKVQAGDDAADAAWFDVQVEELTGDSDEKVFRLILTEKDIRLEADVQVQVINNGIFRSKKYKILNKDGIAFDHARGILQALDYLVLHI
jgi:8-oxo-dGTP diphosphatase